MVIVFHTPPLHGFIVINARKACFMRSPQFQPIHLVVWISQYIMLVISGVICRPAWHVYQNSSVLIVHHYTKSSIHFAKFRDVISYYCFLSVRDFADILYS